MTHARYVILVIGAAMIAHGARAQRLSAATDGQRPPGINMEVSELVPPIRLFDNLYYVGSNYVSAYMIVTSAGLIMIDSLHDDLTERSLRQLRDLGLETTDIRYLIVSHGHRDHFGGAEVVRAHSGARVAMAESDWEMLAASTGRALQRDIVIEDGETLTLGDTTLSFYHTPGHTPGVTSIEFFVHDGEERHKVFFHGGHNVTSRDPQAFRAFIDSTKRLQQTLVNVDVSLTSHPWASLIFERAEWLRSRGAGDPHPFVQPQDFVAFLEERVANHEARLAEL